MTPDSVLSSALGELHPGDPEASAKAARAIQRLGATEAEVVAALIEALRSRSREDQEAAARALGIIGPGAAVAIGPLVSYVYAGYLYSDPGYRVPHEGYWALNALLGPSIAARPGAVVDSLTPLLREGDAQVRRCAASILGNAELASPDVVSALIGACSDADPYVRSDALDSLYRLGPAASAACATLVELLTNDDSEISPLDIRAAAAYVLGAVSPADGRVIAALEDALTSAKRAVRINAAWALSKLEPKNRAAHAILTEESSSPDAGARSLALQGRDAIARSQAPATPK